MLIEGHFLGDHGASNEAPALIGPNAVLQLVHAMDRRLGHTPAQIICEAAGLSTLPDGTAMIPESDALHLHEVLNCLAPTEAMGIAVQAGRGTADYIIANRIPRVIAALLRALPASLAAPLLMAAIRKHAWTFIGSGEFTPHTAWQFTIDRSGSGAAGSVPETTFEWYAAVFERLYQSLVGPDCKCSMTDASTASRTQRSYRLYGTAGASDALSSEAGALPQDSRIAFASRS